MTEIIGYPHVTPVLYLVLVLRHKICPLPFSHSACCLSFRINVSGIIFFFYLLFSQTPNICTRRRAPSSCFVLYSIPVVFTTERESSSKTWAVNHSVTVSVVYGTVTMVMICWLSHVPAVVSHPAWWPTFSESNQSCSESTAQEPPYIPNEQIILSILKRMNHTREQLTTTLQHNKHRSLSFRKNHQTSRVPLYLFFCPQAVQQPVSHFCSLTSGWTDWEEEGRREPELRLQTQR